MRAVSNFSIYQVSNCMHVYLWLPVILFRLYFWPWQKIHSSGNMWHFLHYLCSPLTQIAAFIFAVALLHLGEKLDHHLVRSYLFPHLNNVNENKNKEKNYKPSHRRKCNSKNTHYKTSWTLRGCKFEFSDCNCKHWNCWKYFYMSNYSRLP